MSGNGENGYRHLPTSISTESLRSRITESDKVLEELNLGKKQAPQKKGAVSEERWEWIQIMRREKAKVVPLPSSLSTQTRSPCACRIFRTMESPRPVPPMARERPLSTR